MVRRAGEPAEAAPTEAAGIEAKARAIVYRQLALRARSRAQLEAKLSERGIPDEVARGVLDRFEDAGLVDDAAYAEAAVRSRRAQRGLSRRALALALRSDGVGGEVAEEALAGITREDELTAALALARRKAASTSGLDRVVRERRIAGMLGRKGYPADVVVTAMRQALEEEQDAG